MPQSPVFSSDQDRNDAWIAFLVLALFGYGIYALTMGDRDDDSVARDRTERENELLNPATDVFGVSAVSQRDRRRAPKPVPEKLPIKPVVLSTNSPAVGEVYEPVPVIPTEAMAAVPAVVVPAVATRSANAATQPDLPVRNTRPVPQSPTNGTLAFARDELATTNNPTPEAADADRAARSRLKAVAEPAPTPDVQRRTKAISPALPAGSCTVIAGSFKSANNRNTMRRELIKDGYQVVVGQLNSGLYYAGIPVGCQDSPTRRRVANELQRKYEISAWTLRQ